MMSVAALMLTATIACTSGEEGNAGSDKPVSKTDSNMTASGFPIAQQPLKLKFFARKSPPNGPYENMLVFQEYEKKTNMDIEWEDVPQEGFTERKNLLFASNELPDALFKAAVTPLEAVKYGSSGMLIPLEGLIDKHAPNLQKLMKQFPEIRSAISAPDGHIYALPGIVTLTSGRTSKPWLNKTWLQKLNLQEPKTTDELVQVLKAFRDNDPNGNGKKDDLPMSERSWDALISTMSGSWGLESQMGYYIQVKDDKVQIWVTDPRFKEYLQFLHMLYQEKLLDQEVFTQTESQFVGKMASGNIGFFHNQASDPFTKKKDDFKGIAPFAGPHGDQKVNANPIARDFGTFAITSVNKHPEATMRWIDHFYGEEGSIFFRYGIEGKTYNLRKDGLPEYTDEIWNDKRGTGTTIGQFSPWPGGGAPHLISEKNSSAINPAEVQEAQTKLDPYMPKQVFGAPLFDDKTVKEVNALRQDIDTYIAETTTKMITGAVGFDKWDEYVKTLEKMDLARLQKIYQTAYDSNYKKK
jgi:putative aldouronate transport system substrate-binding protein